MSTELTYKCDGCGKELDLDDRVRIRVDPGRNVRIISYKDYDYCLGCVTPIARVMDIL